MDTLEFLGGKYRGGEQILPGVIQTYRAMESASGRSVFVHRVASTDDPNEQVILYRLLSAALVRSPAVRSMVLDIREDSREWFVVTETDARCLLLREWLQFELDNSGKAPEAEKKAPVAEQKNGASAVSMPAVSPAAAGPAEMETEAVTPKAAEEPGEFTRFFRGGPTPALPPKSSQQERPSRTGIVQRPNTPMPMVTPAPPPPTPPINLPADPPSNVEDGEFTKIFNRPQAQTTPARVTPLGAHQSANDFDNLFVSKSPEFAMPAQSAGPEPGEFTRTFGDSNTPSVRPPSALGERARTDFDDPLAIPGTPIRPVQPSAPASVTMGSAASSAGPSEYTRIISGNKPAPAEPPGPNSAGSASGALPISLPVLAAPPVPHVPAPSLPPLPAVAPPPMQIPAVSPPAMGPGAQAAPAGPLNRKLIIFLSVLGVLALILILLVFFALRK